MRYLRILVAWATVAFALTPARGALAPRPTLWLQIEAGDANDTVIAAVRASAALNERYGVLDRSAGLAQCCTDTACLVGELGKSGAAGALVVRVVRQSQGFVATAKVVFPTLTGVPRGKGTDKSSPAVAAVAAVKALLGAAPLPAGAKKVVILPPRPEGAHVLEPAFFEDFLAVALAQAGRVEVRTIQDIEDLLGRELRPTHTSAAPPPRLCPQIAPEALDTELIVATGYQPLDSGWVLTLKLLEIKSTKRLSLVGRHIQGDAGAVLGEIEGASRELLAKAGIE